jgi:prepilin-type N-terminal cleavage/methylation domain-containing protein/prepilin-type processing-associated H-X9-DG protein
MSVRDGFSLLELLIVVALIIVLFTLYWSGGSRAFQTKQLANCEKNLQNIYVALKTYAIANDGRLPVLANSTTSEPVLSQLIPRYTTGTEFFICPGGKDSALPEAQPFADRKISYAYYMGHKIDDGASEALMSDRQVDTNSKSQGQPLFSSDGKKPGNNHYKYGGNILFCDGNVQISPASSAFNLTNSPNVVLLNPKP